MCVETPSVDRAASISALFLCDEPETFFPWPIVTSQATCGPIAPELAVGWAGWHNKCHRLRRGLDRRCLWFARGALWVIWVFVARSGGLAAAMRRPHRMEAMRCVLFQGLRDARGGVAPPLATDVRPSGAAGGTVRGVMGDLGVHRAVTTARQVVCDAAMKGVRVKGGMRARTA